MNTYEVNIQGSFSPFRFIPIAHNDTHIFGIKFDGGRNGIYIITKSNVISTMFSSTNDDFRLTDDVKQIALDTLGTDAVIEDVWDHISYVPVIGIGELVLDTVPIHMAYYY